MDSAFTRLNLALHYFDDIKYNIYFQYRGISNPLIKTNLRKMRLPLNEINGTILIAVLNSAPEISVFWLITMCD